MNGEGIGQHDCSRHDLSPRGHVLPNTMLLNIIAQGAQRCENFPIIFVVGMKLKTVLFGDGQGDLERIYRVEPQAITEQWFNRIDTGWVYFRSDYFCRRNEAENRTVWRRPRRSRAHL